MALKTLKPFDCEEADELVVRISHEIDTNFLKYNKQKKVFLMKTVSHMCHQCKAKENYDAAIGWSLELITDYRIRIGECCPFKRDTDKRQ